MLMHSQRVEGKSRSQPHLRTWRSAGRRPSRLAPPSRRHRPAGQPWAAPQVHPPRHLRTAESSRAQDWPPADQPTLSPKLRQLAKAAPQLYSSPPLQDPNVPITDAGARQAHIEMEVLCRARTLRGLAPHPVRPGRVVVRPRLQVDRRRRAGRHRILHARSLQQRAHLRRHLRRSRRTSLNRALVRIVSRHRAPRGGPKRCTEVDYPASQPLHGT